MSTYIGTKEILTVEELLDISTPGGSEMVRVGYEEGMGEVMPKKRFEALSREEPYTLTEMQDILNTKVGSLLFSVLHEYGVKVGETGQITDALIELVNLSHSRAKEILIGYEASLTPLIVINDILVKERNGKSKENSDGASS